MTAKPKPSKLRALPIFLRESEDPEAAQARSAISAETNGALVAGEFSSKTYGELSLAELIPVLRAKIDAVHGGDLGEAEALLTAQAFALNAIFTELARRAAINIGEYMETAERYLRLALKAQNQSRATLETLAAIKNPPVFAHQANIARGPQQVNNGMNTPGGLAAVLRAANSEPGPNELLGATNEPRLDPGAEGAAIADNPQLATVGAIHRAPDRSRQGPFVEKR